MSPWTRRRFLGTSGLAALGTLPACASWPARGPREATRILFFTDVHARTEWDTPAALELAAAAMNREAADVVVAGGDLITDGFQSQPAAVAARWEAYLAMHRAIRPPVVAAIGNHDLVAAIPEDGGPPAIDPRAQFRRLLGVARTWRRVDSGGLRLLLLDAIEVVGGELQYRGFVDEPQLQWLAAELASVPPGISPVVVTHMPLLSAFYTATAGATAAAPPNRMVVNNREVLELLVAHRVPLVLQGHLHVDELLRWRGTTFVTGGAVCGKWWRGSWYGTGPGFGVLTLRPDRVDWAYRGYGWTPRRP